MRTLSLTFALFGLLALALPAAALDSHEQAEPADVAEPPDGAGDMEEAEAAEGSEEGAAEDADKEAPKPE